MTLVRSLMAFLFLLLLGISSWVLLDTGSEGTACVFFVYMDFEILSDLSLSVLLLLVVRLLR